MATPDYSCCPPIANLITQDVLQTLKRLDLGETVGVNNKIDFIQVSDMDYPVMYGVDTLNRSFLAFKIKLSENNQESNPQTNYIEEVSVFYQEDAKSTKWCYDSYYSPSTIFPFNVVLEEHYPNLEQRLLKLYNTQVIKNIDQGLPNLDLINGNGNINISLSYIIYGI